MSLGLHDQRLFPPVKETHTSALVRSVHRSALTITVMERVPQEGRMITTSEKGVKKSSTPTYYARKDEIMQLEAEAKLLEQKLDALQKRDRLRKRLAVNEYLRNYIYQRNVDIEQIQSLAFSCKSQRLFPPFSSYIHLTTHFDERRSTLQDLFSPKIHEAVSYTLARAQFLDLSRSTQQHQAFQGDTGDFHISHFDITPLEHARSVRHAFTETLHFMDNQEIALTEKLGVLTIRESDMEANNSASQVRILSTHDNGVQVESNLAVFSHYFEKSEFLHRPLAVAVLDSIDVDELFPFQPETRIRKDMCAVSLITEYYPTTHTQPVVTMIRYGSAKIHSSPLFGRQGFDQEILRSAPTSCEAMLVHILERLKWTSGLERQSC